VNILLIPLLAVATTAPTFDVYRTPVETIVAPAAPDYATAPDLIWLEARVAGYEPEVVEFAGRYAVLISGCGTACQAGAIVDLSDGSLHPIPTASAGYEFRADSALLLVNPPEEIEQGYGEGRPSWLHSYAYRWDETSMAFELLWTDDPEHDRTRDDD
jgi:hypothetical protein